jgi:peptidoglycan/LPS O-acetylase OafA/YrhL
MLLWLGSRSYAVYLIHVPVYFIVREAAHRAGVDLMLQPVAVLLVSALAIALLAEASFRGIEAPWRNRGRVLAAHWLARRRQTAADAAERTS